MRLFLRGDIDRLSLIDFKRMCVISARSTIRAAKYGAKYEPKILVQKELSLN